MNDPDKPYIEIFVTEDVLSEEDYRAVEAQLRPYFRVGGGPVWEFSEAIVAHVVVELTANTVRTAPPDYFDTRLYEAFKAHLLKPEQADGTFFEFKLYVGNRRDKYTYGSLETNDETALRDALIGLKELAAPEAKYRSFEFNRSERRWERYS